MDTTRTEITSPPSSSHVPADQPQRAILRQILTTLTRVYALVEAVRDEKPVLVRVDVKPAMLTLLDDPRKPVYRFVHELEELAITLAPSNEPDSFFPSNEASVEDWVLSLTQPGTLMLDDTLDTVREACTFDMPFEMVTVCTHLAIAQGLIASEDDIGFSEFILPFMEGNACAHEVITRYRQRQEHASPSQPTHA